MKQDRRYQEHEVEQIFEAAASPEPPGSAAASAEGLTLAELQAIGREVGLAPERIADAAASLERGGTTAIPRRTSFGAPISTGRIVDLPRPLTDREWALLVIELREVFNARGRESSEGALRQWSNGNLHALVEPTLDGYRLRLGTTKGNAMLVNRLGASGVVLGAAMAGGMLLAGEPAVEFVSALLTGGTGAGALAFNALRLPRWVTRRERQMDHIVERTRVIVASSRGCGTGDAIALD